ncbi:MAG: type VI secretion system contractile sheath small subunit [Pseudomonadota bacterium]
MSSNKPTVAPRERINITFKPDGDGMEEKELPMKVLAIGDYTLRDDDTPLEDRAPISIDKQNFNEVLAEQKLSLTLSVEDKLSGEEDGAFPVELSFDSMKDFRPESLVNAVPELAKLVELRDALLALKGPLGNVPDFRKRMQEMMKSDEQRKAVLDALGLSDD